MTVLNDREITSFAFKEAISREKHMAVKLRFYKQLTRDRYLKELCTVLLASCESRLNILQREMKNLNIKN